MSLLLHHASGWGQGGADIAFLFWYTEPAWYFPKAASGCQG